MYKPTGFATYELVPKDIYEKEGDNALARMDIRMLWTLTALKTVFSDLKMVINDWKWNGLFQYRGFRPVNCGVGTITGAHYFGGACDIDFYDKKTNKLISAQEMIDIIVLNIEKFPWIRAIEQDDGQSRIHIDVWDEYDSDKRIGINKNNVLLFNVKDSSKNYIVKRKAA